MADFDVVVIGAGAAGLAAARALSHAGLSVAILEARDRIGGRIFTVRPDTHALPVELGAEFVHGRPPEVLTIAQAAGLAIYERGGVWWNASGGKLRRADDEDDGDEDGDGGMDAILGAIGEWQGDDMSLDAFLKEQFPGKRWAQARRQASGYVQGFDAADPDTVSVRWLAQTEAAAASIDGERLHRVMDGYDTVLAWLRAGLDPARTALRLNTVVHEVRWKPGHVEVEARSALGTPLDTTTARAAVVTLPIGVLAAPEGARGAVQFVPEAPGKREAPAGIAMGDVVRVVLRFREAFWDALVPDGSLPQLPRLSFLTSDDEAMPTWWTVFPLLAPVLTGWVGGPRATLLAREPSEVIAERALGALGRVLGVSRRDLEARLDGWWLHNWSADPFSRGAYSFIRAGGMEAPGKLGEPVEGTLFFAGEATDTKGHTGTVHAALASGYRAAAEVTAALAGG